MSPIHEGERVTRRRAAQQRVGSFPDGAHPGEQAVAGAVVDAEVAALGGGVHTDASSLVAQA